MIIYIVILKRESDFARMRTLVIYHLHNGFSYLVAIVDCSAKSAFRG